MMPPQCPASGEKVTQAGVLGPSSWAALHFIEAPFCKRCGVPFAADYGAGIECPACIASAPVYDSARAALSYNDASRQLVSAFKFHDRTELAAQFGQWMARAGTAFLKPETIVAPVPLHWRRLMARRFNQSAMLAQAVAEASGSKVMLRGLSRTRATPPQRDLASPDARQRNVAGAFIVKERLRPVIEGAHIVLIDDVLTTGATVSACARALKNAKASQVDVLVLARVVKGGGGAI